MATTPEHSSPSEIRNEMMGKTSVVERRDLTPSEANKCLLEDEKATLEYIRERDQGFWKRVKTYEKLIDERARSEAQSPDGVLSKMQGLGLSTTDRLRFLSRKSVDRFAQITSRIDVANQTLTAVHKRREAVKDDMATITAGRAALAEQVKQDHPIAGRISFLRNHLLPATGESVWGFSVEKLRALDYTKLQQAAQNVKQESMTERQKWEQEIATRLGGARRAEDGLRNLICKYNKDAPFTIEKALRSCAAGDTGAIEALVGGMDLDAKNYPVKEKEELKKELELWIRQLSKRSGNLSKAFEVAGRLELRGTLAETFGQLRGLPVGTRLLVDLEGSATKQEVVLYAKKGSYLQFKLIGSADQYVVVDFEKKESWKYENATVHQQLGSEVIRLLENNYKPTVVSDRQALRVALYEITGAYAEGAAIKFADFKAALDTKLATPPNVHKDKDAILKVCDTQQKGLEVSLGKWEKKEYNAGLAPHTMDPNKLSFSYPPIS